MPRCCRLDLFSTILRDYFLFGSVAWLTYGGLAIAGGASDLGAKFVDLLLPQGFKSMEAEPRPFIFVFNSFEA